MWVWCHYSHNSWLFCVQEGLVGELMPLLCPNSSEGNGNPTHTIVSIRNLEFALFLRMEKILKVEKHMCLPGREP